MAIEDLVLGTEIGAKPGTESLEGLSNSFISLSMGKKILDIGAIESTAKRAIKGATEA